MTGKLLEIWGEGLYLGNLHPTVAFLHYSGYIVTWDMKEETVYRDCIDLIIQSEDNSTE